MTDLKAKLDALSAKAGHSASIDRHCGLMPMPTAEYVTELVNAYRTGQLIVAPAPTAALQEVVEALEQCRKNVYRLQQGGDRLCAALRTIANGCADPCGVARAALNHKAPDDFSRAAVADGDLIGGE